jgi:hypothetical protein
VATPKGRTLRKPEQEAKPPQPVIPPPPAGKDPRSPFGGFGPEASSMTASAEESRQKSMSVFVIVGGIAFAVISALIVALAMLLLLLVYKQMQDPGEVANKDEGPQHISDTAVGGDLPELPEPKVPRPGGVGPGDDGKKSERDPSLGPPPGPASVIVPKTTYFVSMEVNCPSGLRARGTFAKYDKTRVKATVQGVPADERCTVTFQGAESAKTWISGHQTLDCTFDPIVCSKVGG